MFAAISNRFRNFSKNRLLDVASLLLIATVIAGLAWQSDFLKVMYEDYAYHLLVAQNYSHAGGITTWDHWESAPVGRPQNYPPVWQFSMSWLIGLPLDPSAMHTFFSLLAIGLGLSLAWLGIRLWHGSLTAFFFLILAASFGRYITLLGVITPSSLVLASFPLLAFLLKEKRWIGAGALLTIMLYTHMIIPWLVIGTLGAWYLWKRDWRDWRQFFGTIAAAIALYLPWGLLVFQNRRYILYTDPNYLATPRIPDLYLSLSLLALSGLALAIFSIARLRNRPNLPSIAPWVILMVAQVPILYSNHPSRFGISGGAFMMMIISAVGLRYLWQQPKFRLAVAAVLVFCALYSVELSTIGQNGQQIISSAPSLLRQIASYENSDLAFYLQPMNVFTPENIRLAEVIRNNTEKNDVIYNANDYFNLEIYPRFKHYMPAQFFGSIAGRPIANARNPEYYWQAELPLEKAKIVIADLRQTHIFTGEKKKEDSELADKLASDFELIAQEDRTLVFKNKSDEVFKMPDPDSAINRWAAMGLLVLALSLISRELLVIHRTRS